MASFVVLLGPPGVGKGTQAEVLSKRLSMPHVSSGELFRENMRSRTPLGQQAQEYLDRGALVPDDLTIAMIRDRLSQQDCVDGAILDGFPRTPPQADALDEMLGKMSSEIGLVPFISAPEQVLVQRVGGRLTCRAHGHVYHAQFSPPAVAGKCDVDGSELYEREDDRPETIAKRIQVYLRETAPLVEHYRSQGKVVDIDGTRAIDDVTAALLKALGRSV
jgi:adenylate kinase